MNAVDVLLFAIVGVVIGLIGSGGSILTVPVLVYVLRLEDKTAIATSLLIVAITSGAAAAQHAWARNIAWRVAFIFALTGMLGAFAGGLLARFFPGPLLLIVFAGVMIAAAVAMMGQPHPLEKPASASPPPDWLLMVEGVAVGLLTGLVGAGGGFLIVPALALGSRIPMHRAVGSSTIVIALKSLSALLGYASHVGVEYRLAAMASAMAVAGSFLGIGLGKRLSQSSLRRGFSIFVLAMAFYMLYREIPSLL